MGTNIDTRQPHLQCQAVCITRSVGRCQSMGVRRADGRATCWVHESARNNPERTVPVRFVGEVAGALLANAR